MSKSSDHVLLVPGESGWEIWTSQGDGGWSLNSATELDHAGDLPTLPTGELSMLFPMRAVTAVPMRVASDDDALFPDLVALHAERLGLRNDPMSGQLSDVFVIHREAENTGLLAVFLRPLGEGDLPARGPKHFDLSARAYPVEGDGLAVWREFGRWVFAAYHHGRLVYCQATAVETAQPDAALAREIRLSLMQLVMQGIKIEPTRILIWASGEIEPTDFAATFEAPVEVLPRPAPMMPDPPSKLLPADVRAARRASRQRRHLVLGVAAVLVIYLGLIGWLGFGLWQTHQETRNLLRQAQEAAPDGEAYTAHIAKWAELEPAINLNNSPVDILFRIAQCIPPNSGLRLQLADINAKEITLKGEAQALQAVNTFSLKLTKNAELAKFKWQAPEPRQSTRGWEFDFKGEVPSEEANP